MDNRLKASLDEACRVRPADLAHLAVLRQTLSVLNDAGASAARIAECIERFPALKARVQRRLHHGESLRPGGESLRPGGESLRPGPSLAVHLARLGNREFEKLLLELLEDLTILRGDLDEAAERKAAISGVSASLPPPQKAAPVPGR